MAGSFNPRARMGRDAGPPDLKTRHLCFNPRARMGRDADPTFPFKKPFVFQSTRPHGARRGRVSGAARPRRFNPRARMGRDNDVPDTSEV